MLYQSMDRGKNARPYKIFLTWILLYLVLVVIKLPISSIDGRKTLIFRDFCKKKGLILCQINSIIQGAFPDESRERHRWK